MPDTLPYVVSPGMINTAFSKIKAAATPERFTQDFLSTTLGLKGGGPKPMIPFLKRIGFLGTDGAPTDIYRSFRNPAHSRLAVAQAMRIGYKALFHMNERAHELPDLELRGLVVQATGLEDASRVVQLIVATFKTLKSHASFESKVMRLVPEQPQVKTDSDGNGRKADEGTGNVGIQLSYTINLNLPATADVSVFNAIFRALRENLLKP